MKNPYARDVSAIKTLDPYRLQELYGMHPCAEHVVKKLLVAGEREGGKDLDHDISDCIRTLTRWQEMRAEDKGERLDTTCEATTVTMYDWSLVNPRFKWIAKDRDNGIYAYTDCPRYNLSKGVWDTEKNYTSEIIRLPGFSIPVAPANSLESRP